MAARTLEVVWESGYSGCIAEYKFVDKIQFSVANHGQIQSRSLLLEDIDGSGCYQLVIATHQGFIAVFRCLDGSSQCTYSFPEGRLGQVVHLASSTVHGKRCIVAISAEGGFHILIAVAGSNELHLQQSHRIPMNTEFLLPMKIVPAPSQPMFALGCLDRSVYLYTQQDDKLIRTNVYHVGAMVYSLALHQANIGDPPLVLVGVQGRYAIIDPLHPTHPKSMHVEGDNSSFMFDVCGNVQGRDEAADGYYAVSTQHGTVIVCSLEFDETQRKKSAKILNCLRVKVVFRVQTGRMLLSGLSSHRFMDGSVQVCACSWGGMTFLIDLKSRDIVGFNVMRRVHTFGAGAFTITETSSASSSTTSNPNGQANEVLTHSDPCSVAKETPSEQVMKGSAHNITMAHRVSPNSTSAVEKGYPSSIASFSEIGSDVKTFVGNVDSSPTTAPTTSAEKEIFNTFSSFHPISSSNSLSSSIHGSTSQLNLTTMSGAAGPSGSGGGSSSSALSGPLLADDNHPNVEHLPQRPSLQADSNDGGGPTGASPLSLRESIRATSPLSTGSIATSSSSSTAISPYSSVILQSQDLDPAADSSKSSVFHPLSKPGTAPVTSNEDRAKSTTLASSSATCLRSATQSCLFYVTFEGDIVCYFNIADHSMPSAKLATDLDLKTSYPYLYEQLIQCAALPIIHRSPPSSFSSSNPVHANADLHPHHYHLFNLPTPDDQRAIYKDNGDMGARIDDDIGMLMMLGGAGGGSHTGRSNAGSDLVTGFSSFRTVTSETTDEGSTSSPHVRFRLDGCPHLPSTSSTVSTHAVAAATSHSPPLRCIMTNFGAIEVGSGELPPSLVRPPMTAISSDKRNEADETTQEIHPRCESGEPSRRAPPPRLSSNISPSSGDYNDTDTQQRHGWNATQPEDDGFLAIRAAIVRAVLSASAADVTTLQQYRTLLMDKMRKRDRAAKRIQSGWKKWKATNSEK